MHTLLRFISVAFSGFLALGTALGQPGWEARTDSTTKDRQLRKYASGTFGSSRLINFHTVEIPKKKTLEFRISHRFGLVKTGKSTLWGIDGPANIRIGFDYSLTDNLVIGLGRTSNRKMVDGLVKYRLLRQTEGHGTPLSLVWVSSISITTEKDPNAALNGYNKYHYASSRMAFMHQLIAARKFSARMSLQVMPTLIHYNQVELLSDKNDMFLVPVSGRYKFSKRMALTGEYGFRTFAYVRDKKQYHNSASLGLDMETGGHVFQLFFSNSYGINEVQALPYTTANWAKGECRFGFSISRVF